MADITDQWFTAVAVNGDYKTMHVWDGDGDINRVFEFNFQGGYINQSDIKAFMVHNETQERTDLTITFIGTNTVRLNLAVPVTHKVTIYRDTNKVEPLAKFADGAIITAKNLDRNAKQAIFAVAEMVDRFDSVTATADEAIAVAYAARDMANSALVRSENALYTSGIALDASNAAQTAALNAQTASAGAVATANQASTVANGISETANTALVNSQTAVNTANGIDAKATKALANSNTATTTANEARTTANGIDAKATQALDNSATAVNTANAANTTANKALTVANNAVTQGAALNRAVNVVSDPNTYVYWKYNQIVPNTGWYGVNNSVGNGVPVVTMDSGNVVTLAHPSYQTAIRATRANINASEILNLNTPDVVVNIAGTMRFNNATTLSWRNASSTYNIHAMTVGSDNNLNINPNGAGVKLTTGAGGVQISSGIRASSFLAAYANTLHSWDFGARVTSDEPGVHWQGYDLSGNASAAIILPNTGNVLLRPKAGQNVRSGGSLLYIGGGNTRIGSDGNVVGSVWGGTEASPVDLKTYIDNKVAAHVQNSLPRRVWAGGVVGGGAHTTHFASSDTLQLTPLPPDSTHPVVRGTWFTVGNSITCSESIWGKRLFAQAGGNQTNTTSLFELVIPPIDIATNPQYFSNENGVDVRTTHVCAQFPGAYYYLRISPDGKTLAMMGGQGQALLQLYVVDYPSA